MLNKKVNKTKKKYCASSKLTLELYGSIAKLLLSRDS